MPRAPGLPGEFVAVYGPTGLAVFAVAGLVIRPRARSIRRWAARARPATALRAE